MVKLLKWMYELGYKAAVKDVLATIDKISNPKPNESDFKGRVRTEEDMTRWMSNATIVYKERKMFKNHMHHNYDPDYRSEPNDLVLKELGLDDDNHESAPVRRLKGE